MKVTHRIFRESNFSYIYFLFFYSPQTWIMSGSISVLAEATAAILGTNRLLSRVQNKYTFKPSTGVLCDNPRTEVWFDNPRTGCDLTSLAQGLISQASHRVLSEKLRTGYYLTILTQGPYLTSLSQGPYLTIFAQSSNSNSNQLPKLDIVVPFPIILVYF